MCSTKSRTILAIFSIVFIKSSISAPEYASHAVTSQLDFHGHDGIQDTEEFANEWVVHLENGTNEVAQLLAAKMNYICLGEIPGFPNFYLMQKSDHPVVSTRNAFHHTRSLEDDARVLWAQQLFRKTRVKRDFFHDKKRRVNPDEPIPIPDLLTMLGLDEKWARILVPRRPLLQRGSDDDPRGIPDYLLALWDEEEESKNKNKEITIQDDFQMFNDKQWKDQWYMTNTRHARAVGQPDVDLRVVQVYKEFKLSGKGIRVVVLDDGLQHDHPDINKNYDPSISYDYNNGTVGDADPFPDQRKNYPNSHGTRCAGEIAMVANNLVCGVGVAYEAYIGAIRMLDGVINDRVEGLSLQHAIDKVDIFSASWGPNDDGKTVEGPGRMALTALINGVTKGRGGKGIIYVWASGNGGMNDDNCNCDGYTSSMYTISIGSTSQRGHFPWYGERCASTLATTFSSGDSDEKQVATTDINGECTEGHTGTSAAAPLAAGIIALVLQQNPLLTWRDVQHLVVWSSKIDSVWKNPGWYTNGIGLPYNHRFGFGVMDAYRMVSMASEWTNVDTQHTCIVESGSITNPTLSGYKPSISTFTSDACKDLENQVINYIEHVEVLVNIQYPRRGNLEMVLESPSGTMSQLLTHRPKDTSNEGLSNYRFTTNHLWGENPSGEWRLYVIDRSNLRKISNDIRPEGNIGELKIFLHGTATIPEIQKMAPLKDKLIDDEPQNLESGLESPEVRFERFLNRESPLDVEKEERKRSLTWDDIVNQDLDL